MIVNTLGVLINRVNVNFDSPECCKVGDVIFSEMLTDVLYLVRVATNPRKDLFRFLNFQEFL